MFTRVEYNFSVDDDVEDTFAVLQRVCVRSEIIDLERVENSDVGIESGT